MFLIILILLAVGIPFYFILTDKPLDDTVKQSNAEVSSSSNKLQEAVNQMQGEELLKQALHRSITNFKTSS